MQDPAVATHDTRVLNPRQVFLKWELLRIPYNFILIAVTLLFTVWLSPYRSFWDPGYLVFLVSHAFLANACFTVGPGAEAYVTWLAERPVPWLRGVLFALGTLFSVALVPLCIAMSHAQQAD
jgi:hypothetical protein